MPNVYHAHAKFILTLPGKAIQEIELAKALTTIGRRKSNDIQLPVPTVSGQHARIERTARGFTLTDLASTNGTFVNGQKLISHVPQLLEVGDTIHIGQVTDDAPRLVFRLSPTATTDETLLAKPAPLDDQQTLAGAEPPAPALTGAAPAEIARRGLFFGDEDPEEKAAALAFERNLAVVIGIDAYKHGIPPLGTAGNDAQRLSKILHSQFEYEVLLLADDGNQGTGDGRQGTGPPQAPSASQILSPEPQTPIPEPRYLGSATKDALLILLTETLPAQIDENDRVLVYFAGHGIALDGDDGPSGYLVPQDGRPEDRTTFLGMNELHDALMALPCRHMLVILDCCFAGAMRWSSTRDLQLVPDVIHQERYERFIRAPAWQVITSAAYDQKALDVLAGEVLGERGDTSRGGHSPFALALFEALAGAGDVVPAGGGDGVITASELYLYLRDYVEIKAEAEAQHMQTPSLWPLKKHDKGEYIFLVPGHALNLPPAPELTYENNPYRGLQSFDEEHAELFFGRAALVEQLAAAVEQQPLTVVLGASGTGKSSLVKAGLVPYLGGTGEADLVAGGNQLAQQWYILPPVRPTDAPLKTLANLLNGHRASPNPAAISSDDLKSGIAAQLAAHPGQKLLLIIDQSEELVTLCRDEQERAQFVTVLSEAVATHSDRLRVILTLRSDFEPQVVGLFEKNGGLEAVTIKAGDSRLGDPDSDLTPESRDPNSDSLTLVRFIVPPMSQAELRDAIEGPASVRVLYFEPSGLIDQLIDEVIQTPGALPLLSFTLSEMYVKYLDRRSDNRALTQQDYEALGGVIGSLRNRASEEYDRLDPAHQETMKRIMLRMVAVEGGELARRRVPRRELVFPNEAENVRVEAILQRLLAVRLIVGGQTDGQPYVEPAHDALVRAWDKLLLWKTEAEDYLPLQRRLTQAANDWAAADTRQKQDLLWHNNPRLPQLQQILEESRSDSGRRGVLSRAWRSIFPATEVFATTTWLNRQETNFVQASIVKKGKNLRRLVSTVAFVIAALSGLTIFAFIQQGIAETQRVAAVTSEANAEERRVAAVTSEANAEARRIAAETAEAVAEDRRIAAQNAEATAQAERDEALRQARRSQAGQLAAQVGAVIGQREEKTGSLALLLGREAVLTTLHADNYIVPEADEALRLAVDDASPWLKTIHHTDDLNSVAWSADGQFLLTAGDDQLAHIWEVASGQLVRTFAGHTDWVNSAAWSPDERFVLTASGNDPPITTETEEQPEDRELTARIWEVATGQELQRFEGHTGIVNQAVWSPDGQLIVTASHDGTARIWEVATGAELLRLEGHESEVHAVDWSPDGQTIVTAGADRGARLWDAATGQELLVLSGHAAPINAVRWSPDGQFIATASGTEDSDSIDSIASGDEFDFTARIWDATSGQELRRMVGHEAWIHAVAWSPDGRYILTAAGNQFIGANFISDADQTVRIWDVTTGKEVQRLKGHADMVFDAAWSPDGQTIASVSSGEKFYKTDETFGAEHSLRLWRTYGAGQPRLLQPAANRMEDISDLDWSRDGNHIFSTSAGYDRTVRMWDTITGQELRIYDPEPDDDFFWLLGVDSSPDGRLIAFIDYGDYRVRMWDAEAGTEVRVWFHDSEVNSVAWSPAGNYLATSDQRVHIWDIGSGDEIGQLAGERIIDWSSDGQRLMSATPEAVLIWEVASGDLLLELPLSRTDSYPLAWSPDESQFATRENDNRLTIWNIETQTPAYQLVGHTNQINEAAWSPDGSRIATVSGDAFLAFESSSSRDFSARIWEAGTGRELRHLEHPAAVTSLAWSPDGRQLATADPEGGLHIWLAEIDDLLDLAGQLIQREPPDFTAEERVRFGLE